MKSDKGKTPLIVLRCADNRQLFEGTGKGNGKAMKYAIYEGNIDRLEKKLKRISNKCKAYGCDFHYEQTGEEFRELKDEKGNKYTARFVLVEAEGTAIINDWEFIAELEHTENGNIITGVAGVKSVFGLDFGYTNDPSALFCGLIDQSSKTIWVFDEMYQPGMSNEAIAEQVQRMGYVKEKITADSAEPKSIDRLRELGLKGIRKARKGKDSINNGIDFIQDYHIIIHPRCVNFITEISNYQWDKDAKTGKKLNRPIDDFNHLMDAMRYAVESIVKGDAFSFD